MNPVAVRLKQARETAGLSLEELSIWSRLPVEKLRDAEQGTIHLSVEEHDRYARALGLRLWDLIEGKAEPSPMAMLLRSDTDLALDLRSILTTEIDEALGEFQRIVRDIADLERALSIQVPALPRVDASRCPEGMHPGEHRARLVRVTLGLGDEPIASMSALAEQLGVRVIWVTEDQVDKLVDGACMIAPRPAVLVNLLDAGNPYPWRARITLAHELGHILFDLTPGSPLAVSPHSRRLPAHLEEVEQNARAFAACLLAPSEGVRRAVSDHDPSTEEAIQVVGARFGVGRTVAINRLQHVFHLTDSQRSDMERRTARAYQGDFAADHPPEPIGFRGEPLLGLVRRAFARKRSRTPKLVGASGYRRASGFLFPELGDDLCEPPVSPELAVVRNVCVHLLDHHLDLAPGAPQRVGDVWHVPVMEGAFGPGDHEHRGFVIVNLRGEVVEEHISLPSEARR